MLLAMDASRAASRRRRSRHERGQVRAGFAYVRRERELGVPLLMMAIMGCFTYEFQVTLPYLARTTFDGDSRTYGFMTAAMGLGAVIGGLYTAARGRTGIPHAGALVGPVRRPRAGHRAGARRRRSRCCCWSLVGAASVSLMARGNTTLQLASAPEMRGRVMALWLVAFLGTTPLGGPMAGWVAVDVRRPLGPGPRGGCLLRRRGVGAAGSRAAGWRRGPEPASGASGPPVVEPAGIGTARRARGRPGQRDAGVAPAVAWRRLGLPAGRGILLPTASGSRAAHTCPHDPEHRRSQP